MSDDRFGTPILDESEPTTEALGRALRAAQAKLATVLESITDCYFELDDEWRFTAMNQRAATHFRFSRDQALGSVFWEVIPQAVGSTYEQHFRQAAAERIPVHFEAPSRVAPGRSMELHVYPCETGLAVYFRDITQRRHDELQLRRLSDSGMIAILHWDLSGRIIDANERFLELVGYTRQDLETGLLDWAAMTPPEYRSLDDRVIQQLKTTGVHTPYEKEFIRQDGSRVHLLVGAAMLDEQRHEGVAFALDVSDRKRWELALQDANRRLTETLESITDAFFSLDRERRFTYVNREAEQLLRRARGELLGRNIWDSFPQADGSPFQRALEQAMAEQRPTTVETYYAPLESWLEAHVYPSPAGLSVYFRNITARKEDERERERLLQAERAAADAVARASAAKDEFLAVLSHELRTPLTPVLLMASTLRERPDLPADLREDLEMMQRNVEMEARIIDDLLDLTRISRGKLQFHFCAADAHVLAGTAADICGCGSGAPIQLALQAERHHVYGDPARLQQVLWNLLNNARKFTPASGRISVRSYNQHKEGEAEPRLVLEVADTGVGIEPALLPRIFMAFEQGEAGTRRQFGGLGLGLAISRSIMQAHNGAISAHSAGPGHGALFRIELPTMRCEAKAGNGSSAPAPARARKLRILLVEDHSPTAFVISRLLSRSGHEVRTVGSVHDALASAGQVDFDLLLSDVGLPDGSGLEIMRQLKCGRPHLKGIVLSGYGMEEDVRRSLDAGFTEHLTKPIELQTLQAVIERVAANG